MWAARTVERATLGSPAWKPQAMLADETVCIIAVSSPIVQEPKDSPESEFRSMERVVILLDYRALEPPLLLSGCLVCAHALLGEGGYDKEICQYVSTNIDTSK